MVDRHQLNEWLEAMEPHEVEQIDVALRSLAVHGLFKRLGDELVKSVADSLLTNRDFDLARLSWLREFRTTLGLIESLCQLRVDLYQRRIENGE